MAAAPSRGAAGGSAQLGTPRVGPGRRDHSHRLGVPALAASKFAPSHLKFTAVFYPTGFGAVVENVIFDAETRRSMAMVVAPLVTHVSPPWQRPGSDPAPPQATPGGPVLRGTPRVGPGHWDPSHGLSCSSEPPPKSPISLPLAM